jgi:hypothetical protein
VSVHRDRDSGACAGARTASSARARSIARATRSRSTGRSSGACSSGRTWCASSTARADAAEFVDGGFRAYAATLAPKTREHYDWALQHHLRELADEPLLALDVPRLAMHQQFLLERGPHAEHGPRGDDAPVGDPAGRGRARARARQRRARAAEGAGAAARGGRPLAPVELEALIARFTGRAA